jgi:hypothetical protein
MSANASFCSSGSYYRIGALETGTSALVAFCPSPEVNYTHKLQRVRHVYGLAGGQRARMSLFTPFLDLSVDVLDGLAVAERLGRNEEIFYLIILSDLIRFIEGRSTLKEV